MRRQMRTKIHRVTLQLHSQNCEIRSQMSLIRFNFQNNHWNPSSGKSYYSPQNGQPNSDAIIFRGSHWSCSVKRVLKFWQNSQKNTCVRVSFSMKFQALGLQLYWKWDPDPKCFSVNFAIFLRTPFVQNSSRRLLLYFIGGRKTCCSL